LDFTTTATRSDELAGVEYSQLSTDACFVFKFYRIKWIAELVFNPGGGRRDRDERINLIFKSGNGSFVIRLTRLLLITTSFVKLAVNAISFDPAKVVSIFEVCGRAVVVARLIE
jgi:hypothetical protein